MLFVQNFKSKFVFILPTIQFLLGSVSVIVDKSYNNGLGEGRNQEIANLASNIEFVIKSLLGIDDIVNYNFRMGTFFLGIAFWVLIGLAIDLIKMRASK